MRHPPQNSSQNSVLLTERTSTVLGGEKFRYGFNNMEADYELKGNGNSYDFGARMYDNRLGRWLTIDPLIEKYPDLSPFCFVGGNPIVFFDPNGEKIINGYQGRYDEAKLKCEDAKKIYEERKLQLGDDKKAIKVLEKEMKINSLEKEFEKISKKYEKTAQILNTFKAVNPEDYEKLDKLKTSDGQDINIIVLVKDDAPEEPSGVQGMTRYTKTLVKGDKIEGSDDRKVEVIPKLPEMISDGKNIYPAGTIGFEVNLFKNTGGQTTNTLSNEFGDVFYAVKPDWTLNTIKAEISDDKKSFEKYSTTGAGKASFDYENSYREKFNDYLKNNKLSNTDHDGSGTLINPPKE
jgi:RHS repeat-associated protein